jgi:predicted amidophosphoribosyltransferase
LEGRVVSFRDIMYPAITLERFKALRASDDAKRICFGSIHKNALKRSDGARAAGWFNVPFAETISSVFPWPLFRNTRGKFGGYYRAVSDDHEFGEISQWLAENADVVFIRSLFSTAVAACEHYITPERRSRVGELEHSAKYEGDTRARDALLEILEGVYRRMHGGRKIDGIASIPPSKPGRMSLPNLLAEQLSKRPGIIDLTSNFHWNGPKSSIKELDVDQKWAALEDVGLTVSDAFEGKNVLLIDDMYQSGSTAHFVGSKLRAAGANDIHLLAVSKGRRDTDNRR